MLDDESRSMRIIDDDEFARQLALLRLTRRFLIAEGVSPSVSVRELRGMPREYTPLALGNLNLIRYIPRRGLSVVFRRHHRTWPATIEDWDLLEERQAVLQSFFTPELQHRFRLQASQKIITSSPVILLIVTFITIFLAVFPPFLHTGWLFGSYLAWASSLGGLGAIGFLAMNSLAIQNDATFDISNKSLVVMRIILGGLFGSVVSLPFCLPFFKEFTVWVESGMLAETDMGTRGLFLLIPFLLGFSTTLVMAVLNRMVSGVETIFGIERNAAKLRTTDLPVQSPVSEGGAARQRKAVQNTGEPQSIGVKEITR